MQRTSGPSSAAAGHSAGTRPLPTVLVVDDDSRNRLLLSAWLGRSYTVVEAPDGLSALEMLAEVDPDVVILDVMMPGIDGIETCRRIKARVEDGYRPVLLLTALGEQESRNAGLEAGADDFLSKPVDQRELLLRIRTFQLLRHQDRVIRRQLDELRRLDALKEDLVSLVTHDLRNALSGVVIMMEGIQYKGGTCTSEDLTALLGATTRMNETLEDMLRIKLLEDDSLPLDPTIVPVSELLAAAVALVEPAARAKGVTVAPSCDARATVVGDALLLRRSVFNLLQNAVKYSRRGDEVEVSARVADGIFEVQVQDRGPGVADDVRPYLFEKYAGVTVRRPGARTGNGLGLFFVQLVARAHHGAVSVSARDGGGSTFHFVVPAEARRTARA